MSYPSLATSLQQALAAVHQTTPRIIAAPPLSHSSVSVASTAAAGRGSQLNRGKRASVAIIVRIRPTISPNPQHQDSPSGEYVHGRSDLNVLSAEGRSPSPTLRNFQDSSLLRSRPQSSTSVPNNAESTSTPPSADLSSSQSGKSTLQRIDDFFAQPWVRTGVPEILYIKRSKRAGDRWSSQIAFPGGRQEPEDENSLYTALRETWEEVGIDLAEKNEFLEIGQLDDREITTSLGKRLLMVLSPFVFLHTSPEPPIPDIQVSEVASAHWIPVSCLLSPHVRWGDVKIDITSRITPRNKIIRRLLAILTGNMHFKCILLPNDPIQVSPEPSPPSQGVLDPADPSAERPPLSLWGLTLGMTLDLISHMPLRSSETTTQQHLTHFFHGSPRSPYLPLDDASHQLLLLSAPSVTSIFPTFSYPDVNFFIWLFGFRYRNILKRWGERLSHSRNSGSSEPPPSSPVHSKNRPDSGRSANFSGIALKQFYAAVRKALIVAILMRATIALGSLGAGTVWLYRYLQNKKLRAIAR